jgi:hypothetical protein
MRQGLTRRRSRFFALMFAVEVISIVMFNQMSHAQSADSPASCATDAQKTFQDLGREYAAVMDRLNQPYEVVSNDYQSHYSAKARRCLLLVHKTTLLMRELSSIFYLIDADRQMYALYIDTDGKMESCTLIPSVRETRTCKDRSEFDAFVAVYMEK